MMKCSRRNKRKNGNLKKGMCPAQEKKREFFAMPVALFFSFFFCSGCVCCICVVVLLILGAMCTPRGTEERVMFASMDNQANRKKKRMSNSGRRKKVPS